MCGDHFISHDSRRPWYLKHSTWSRLHPLSFRGRLGNCFFFLDTPYILKRSRLGNWMTPSFQRRQCHSEEFHSLLGYWSDDKGVGRLHITQVEYHQQLVRWLGRQCRLETVEAQVYGALRHTRQYWSFLRGFTIDDHLLTSASEVVWYPVEDVAVKTKLLKFRH